MLVLVPLNSHLYFWHKLWYNSGCPSLGVPFQINKHSKQQFKYEVWRLRRQREHIRWEQLGDALSQSGHSDFWRAVYNVAKSSKGTRTNAPCVDHCSCDADIANVFGFKFQALINVDDTLVTNNIESSLSPSGLSAIFVSPHIVSKTLSHLELNESDGTELVSNQLYLCSYFSVSTACQVFHNHAPSWICSYVSQRLFYNAF